MNRHPMLVNATVVVLLIACAPRASAGVIFDAANDFSIASNPNGVWSYGTTGTTLGGPFVRFTDAAATTDGNPNVISWQGTQLAFGDHYPLVEKNLASTSQVVGGGFVTLSPHQMGFHPAPDGSYGDIRFTAPVGGTYSLSSAFEGLDVRGTTTDVHVVLNGVSLFDADVNGTGGASEQSSSTSVILHAGDTLDFAVGVGSNGTFFNDSTAVAVTITSSVPEPSTFTMMGIVALGSDLVNWRRKRRPH